MRLLGTDRKQGRASGASTTISCRAGRGAEKHTGLLLQEGVVGGGCGEKLEGLVCGGFFEKESYFMASIQ